MQPGTAGARVRGLEGGHGLDLGAARGRGDVEVGVGALELVRPRRRGGRLRHNGRLRAGGGADRGAARGGIALALLGGGLEGGGGGDGLIEFASQRARLEKKLRREESATMPARAAPSSSCDSAPDVTSAGFSKSSVVYAAYARRPARCIAHHRSSETVRRMSATRPASASATRMATAAQSTKSCSNGRTHPSETTTGTAPTASASSSRDECSM